MPLFGSLIAMLRDKAFKRTSAAPARPMRRLEGANGMREPVELRRQRILAAAQARGAARVADLAGELEVSVVTVRRDVEELAREGRLRRGHGIARSTLPVPAPPPERAAASGDGDTVV